VDLLQRVSQRRSVVFGEDGRGHVDAVVGAHSEELIVEGGVVNLAHRDAVRNDRLASFGVTEDVCGIEQLTMTEAAEGATIRVCEEYPLAEQRLVQALSHRPFGVTSLQRDQREIGL
jgi:hypothetical protein